MDLLGHREPHIYGTGNLNDLATFLRSQLSHVEAMTNVSGVELTFFQTNSEADYINELNSQWQGIITNPGAWTHTSLAIADRLVGIQVPFVEVHLSNIFARENFRTKSFISSHAIGVVSGLGFSSYLCALIGLLSHLRTMYKS